ncbi:hypothetical protein [Halomontanus rarus]|uniref:hypothetical protein n=1 Tax=Halomontanus rarus TaxID=3034020 RepID=UPI00293BB678|nr:hypothetical protein [Halovivax sp. KZCA124]
MTAYPKTKLTELEIDIQGGKEKNPTTEKEEYRFGEPLEEDEHIVEFDGEARWIDVYRDGLSEAIWTGEPEKVEDGRTTFQIPRDVLKEEFEDGDTARALLERSRTSRSARRIPVIYRLTDEDEFERILETTEGPETPIWECNQYEMPQYGPAPE